MDTEVETVSRGRGSFILDEMADKCAFEWEGGSQEVSLPKAVEDGVALQAAVEQDGIHLILHPHGTAANEQLGLTVSCHGVQKDFQILSSNSISSGACRTRRMRLWERTLTLMLFLRKRTSRFAFG